MPYLWLPAIDGTLNYDSPPGGRGSPDIGIGPTEFLDILNFAVLVSGSVKKGRFIILSEFMYLSMSSTDGRVASVFLRDYEKMHSPDCWRYLVIVC